jgi:hypothetical protein
VKRTLTVAAVLAAATAIGVAAVVASAATSTDPVPTVAREILATSKPANAPGYTLYLVRVTAMPGAVLAKHYHPGTQNAYVVSGSVRYTVFKGAARIFRGPADTATKPYKVITAGHSGLLVPGDWLVETTSLVHQAQVTSPGPFVVLISALFKTGEGLAVPVQ